MATTATTSGVAQKWLDAVKAAAPSGPEAVRTALNKSAFVVGMQIPRNRGVDEKVATEELVQAGIQAGLPEDRARRTVVNAMEAGKAKEEASQRVASAQQPTVS
jgi:hypothetical protein